MSLRGMMGDRKVRLLILDDDAAVCSTLKAMAEAVGAQARICTHPAAFFEALSEWTPTHIALDLSMPDMDGVQVIAELASRRCSARLIISSGLDSRLLEAASRSAGENGLDMAGVLPKPFTLSLLRSLLRESEKERKDIHPATLEQFGETLSDGSAMPSVADLELALQHGELSVAYQPKIACATGELKGFEALARWAHPRLGQIGPDVFIPLAETQGLIDAVTERVLTVALAWFAAWTQGAYASASVASAALQATLSINLSARTLRNTVLIEGMQAQCEALGIDPARIMFELTETSTMDDPTAALGLLTRLRMKGFHLSIDDFGTGYSSMLQLVRLPFSEIKVDRSFVRTAATSQESRTVIRSIVELGRSLGMTSTAEGIEDEAALAYLKQIGCDQAQGFYIARPMTGEATLEWIEQRYGAASS